MTCSGDGGVEKSGDGCVIAGRPQQQNLISLTALSLVNRESKRRLDPADSGGMQQSADTAAGIIAASEQQPACLPIADAHTKIAVGKSDLRLVVAAENRQPFRPVIGAIARHKMPMKAVNAPHPTTTGAEHDQGIEVLQKVMG